MIRAQRRAGLRHFYDGVGELRDFHFRGAPGKFDARFDAVLSRYFSVIRTASVAITLPSRSLHALIGGILGDGQHPAHSAEAGFGVDEFGDFLTPRPSRDPVFACEPGVQRAAFDITRHFLRADHHAFDFGSSMSGIIAARANRNSPSSFAEKFHGGILQASLGNAEFQTAHCFFPFAVEFFRREHALCNDVRVALRRDARKKQLR